MEVLVALCVFIGALLVGGGMFIAFVVAVIAAVRKSGTASLTMPSLRAWLPVGSLLSGGTPARGIMLAVASTGTRTTYYGQRCEVRQARVDIEVRGVAPFELQTNVYIPSNLVRDVLPGSTMELRINPSNYAMVLVVGPDVGYAQGAVRTA